MDCFELRVHERALHDHRIMRPVRTRSSLVQELFEVIERFLHFRNRRRNKRRAGEIRGPGTDPVLRNAKFAGRLPFTSHAAHELGVNLANQAKR